VKSRLAPEKQICPVGETPTNGTVKGSDPQKLKGRKKDKTPKKGAGSSSQQNGSGGGDHEMARQKARLSGIGGGGTGAIPATWGHIKKAY